MNRSVLLRIFLVIISIIGIYSVGNSSGGNGISTSYDINNQNGPEDSLANKAATDSLAALRTYMRSKQYNDSVDAARKARLDSIRVARQAFNDSVKQERIRINDSIATERRRVADSTRLAMDAIREARQASIDSIRVVRQREQDSLSEIREYRTSQAYKDSVNDVRKAMADARKADQKRITDSLVAVRKAEQAQFRAEQQMTRDSIRAVNDSIRAVRQKELDSVRVVRQQYADSMKIVRDKRAAAQEKRDEEKEKKKKLAIQIKIKKKQDKYSNEDLRKKNWSIVRQIIQNTTTRYNYFFNANKKMNEAEKNMYNSRADNLDSTIRLLVFDPDVDSTKMLREMDSLVKRIAIGIQIHDPRAKWQDDLYMLLGKAFYYKGDYANAAASFQYIIAEAERAEKDKLKSSKEKKKVKQDFITPEEEKGLKDIMYHKPSKNDAILWLSRVYLKRNEYTKSRLLLDMAAKSPNLPNRLKGNLNLHMAEYFLSVNQPQQAIPYLDSVAANDDIVKYQRARAAYLAAQLFEKNQDWDNAAIRYANVTRMKPDFDIELKSRINEIAAKINSKSANSQENISTIKGLINESKYKDYKDQLYYGLGNAYAAIQNPKEAIESYKQSIKYNTKTPKLKGKTYYAVGDEYYKNKQYLEAKSAYDSAIVFLTAQDEPLYTQANNKSLGLVAVATPGSVIRSIDSILALSQMSPREQRSAIRNHIANLEREKTATPNTVAATNAVGSWYFSNNTMMQKGEAEFRQKWGNRPLKDNWRRSSGAFGSDIASNDLQLENATNEKLTEDDYLSFIPKEKYLIDSFTYARNLLEYDLGKAFYRLQDYANASTTYTSFLDHNPGSTKREEVYNDLYLIAMKNNNDSLASYYISELKKEYPRSKYLDIINSNTASRSNLVNNNDNVSIQKHYDDTYYLLKQEQFRDVIIRTEEAKVQYPKEIVNYQEQYNLLNAIAYAGIKDYEKGDLLLTQFIAISKNEKLKDWATSVHKLLKAEMAKQSIIATDSTKKTVVATVTDSTSYSSNKDENHIVIIMSNVIDGKFMGLKAGITDFNSLKNSAQNLKTILSSLGSAQELIVIRSFPNVSEATYFMNRLRGEGKLFKDYPNFKNLTFTIISESNYQLLLEKKDFTAYLKFYKNNY